MILNFFRNAVANYVECVSFKMGYRGLPVRKHSAWDSFRRPRGLDFRVCEIPDFLALKKKLFIFIYRARRRARAARCMPGGLAAACVTTHATHRTWPARGL